MSDSAKKKRRLRRACVGGIAAIGGTALLVTTLPALADNDAPGIQAACEVEILPGQSETGKGLVEGIDPTGTYAAGNIAKDSLYEAAIWENGELTKIFDEEHSESKTVAVNSHGVAVGDGVFAEGGTPEPFAYVDGEVVKMATPEGYSRTLISDINDDGAVVGYADGSEGDHPFLWESYDAEPAPLPIPDDAFQVRAKSISEEGLVAGTYTVGERTNTFAHVWDTTDGSATTLEFEGRIAGETVEGDWIIGHNINDESFNTGVRWHGIDASPEKIDFHSVHDVNAQGDIVGNYGAGEITQRAAKYTADDKLYMLPFPGAATDSVATAVSADGLTIAGFVNEENPTERNSLPALWTCDE